MNSARWIKAICAVVAAAGIVAGGAGVATADMSDPPACEQDPNGGCLGGPIGMNGGSGVVTTSDSDDTDPDDPSAPDASAEGDVAGPNWDHPDAYRTIGFVEAPDGTASVDAFGNRYASDQADAINWAVSDAAARGAFGNYFVGTWVPYNPMFGSYREWFSAVLDWYPSCIDYNGTKASGGLPIPDGALCFSRPRP